MSIKAGSPRRAEAWWGRPQDAHLHSRRDGFRGLGPMHRPGGSPARPIGPYRFRHELEAGDLHPNKQRSIAACARRRSPSDAWHGSRRNRRARTALFMSMNITSSRMPIGSRQSLRYSRSDWMRSARMRIRRTTKVSRACWHQLPRAERPETRSVRPRILQLEQLPTACAVS